MRRKVGIALALIMALIMLASIAAPAYASPPDKVVIFPDLKLNEVIHNTLGIPVTEPIQQSDLLNLTKLEAIEPAIKNIAGLEYCINLQWLELSQTSVSNISVLSRLYKLQHLGLANCGLLNNISPLRNLTNLQYLNLEWDDISDITPLLKLANLQTLFLGNNFISDIKPLVKDKGLGSGDYIILANNPLDTNPSSRTMQYIQILIDRGAKVIYPPYPNNYP